MWVTKALLPQPYVYYGGICIRECVWSCSPAVPASLPSYLPTDATAHVCAINIAKMVLACALMCMTTTWLLQPSMCTHMHDYDMLRRGSYRPLCARICMCVTQTWLLQSSYFPLATCWQLQAQGGSVYE